MEQKHQSTLSIFLIAGNSVLGSVFFGYCMGYLNVFNIDQDEQKYNTIKAILNCLLTIGASFGAFGASLILQVLRRKNAFILTDLIGIIGACLGLIINLNTLYASRFVLGIAVGLNSALVPLYIKEYTPLQLRGVIGTMCQISINLGAIIASFFGLGYDLYSQNQRDNKYWRIVFGMPIVFCIIRSIVLQFIFNDDPPIYYVQTEDEEKAKEVLSKVYKKEFVQQQLDELYDEKNLKAGDTLKFSDLFEKKYRFRLIVGCLLMALQQFCGINSVILYSNFIFSEITTNLQLVSWLTILVGLTNLVFSLVAGCLIKKYGRKQLLFVGNFFCFIFLLGLTIFYWTTNISTGGIQSAFIITLIFLYLIAFQLSLGPIAWIYITDILPEKGVSIAVLVNWICTSLILYSFAVIDQKYCFLVFSITCFLGIFFIRFFLKETRGRTAESIDRMFVQQIALLKTQTSLESKKVEDNTADWGNELNGTQLKKITQNTIFIQDLAL